MFKLETSVKLHDTDAAGLLFFASQFLFAHDAYEAYLNSQGLGFAAVLRDGGYKLPIVRAEADYSKPLAVGDRLTVEMTAEKVSVHSFVLAYRLLAADGSEVGRVRTVHVCVDGVSGNKIALPPDLRAALQKIAV